MLALTCPMSAASALGHVRLAMDLPSSNSLSRACSSGLSAGALGASRLQRLSLWQACRVDLRCFVLHIIVQHVGSDVCMLLQVQVKGFSGGQLCHIAASRVDPSTKHGHLLLLICRSLSCLCLAVPDAYP